MCNSLNSSAFGAMPMQDYLYVNNPVRPVKQQNQETKWLFLPVQSIQLDVLWFRSPI